MTTLTPAAGTDVVDLPDDDPFTSLAPHFGMLLGVSDVERIVGHSWAKVRLHNAWLHGPGAVWGFLLDVGGSVPTVRPVDGDPPDEHAEPDFGPAADTGPDPNGAPETNGEVRVGAGLALDGLGRELYLPITYCLDLRSWRERHTDVLGPDIGAPFTAHVVIRFRACPSRPVPALASTCEGAEAGTAYSRIRESAELFLVPGSAERGTRHYPRLRAFLRGAPVSTAPSEVPTAGRDPAADVAHAQQTVAAASRDGQDVNAAALTAARELLALDVIERGPAQAVPTGIVAADSWLYPEVGPDPLDPDDLTHGVVVLGTLRDLRITPTGTPLATVGQIDYSVRPCHVDTAAIVELIRGPAPARPDTGAAPRVVAGSARMVRPEGGSPEVHATLTVPVLASTVLGGASVHRLDPAQGWLPLGISEAGCNDTDLWLRLLADPDPDALMRVVLAGTGPTPVMGVPDPDPTRSPFPLAGTTDGPRVPDGSGADATLSLTGGS